MRFLREAADTGPLQPIYGITGKRDLHEEIVPNLRGYDCVGPVRIGNEAYIQRQHDVNGEMVLCLETILTDTRVVWEDPSLARSVPLVTPPAAIAIGPRSQNGSLGPESRLSSCQSPVRFACE